MAAELGGRATDLGIAYQRLWAVRQLLLTLEGDVSWVQVEPPHADGPGVDVLICRSNGVPEGHQCKRENAAGGKWTIGALNRENILANARRYIERGVHHRFALVSSDPPTDMRDLVERTTRCNDDPVDFYQNHIRASLRLARAFEQLCQFLGFDSAIEHHRRAAFELLRRFDYHPFDKTHNDRDVQRLARQLVAGDPKTVLDVLRGLIERSLGKQLYADDVKRELRDRDLRPRDLRGDPDVLSGIERLQQRFERSYGHLLVGGSPIKRPETSDLLKRIVEPNGPRLFLVHGHAGAGKSGVLYELIRQLIADGIPHLPLRLDRQRPAGTTDNFGRSEACSLPASSTTFGNIWLSHIERRLIVQISSGHYRMGPFGGPV